jgi:hypothetical protein
MQRCAARRNWSAGVRLGSSGLKVSRIGLGMISYGDPAMQQWALPEDKAEPIVRRAVAAGVTFFDTADMYSAGVSEEIRAAAGQRIPQPGRGGQRRYGHAAPDLGGRRLQASDQRGERHREAGQPVRLGRMDGTPWRMAPSAGSGGDGEEALGQRVQGAGAPGDRGDGGLDIDDWHEPDAGPGECRFHPGRG